MNKCSSLLLHLYLHLLHFLIMNKSSNLKKNKNKKTKKVKILNKKKEKRKKKKKIQIFQQKKKSSIKIFNSFKHSRFPNHPQHSSKHGVCPNLGAFARYAEFFSMNNYVTN